MPCAGQIWKILLGTATCNHWSTHVCEAPKHRGRTDLAKHSRTCRQGCPAWRTFRTSRHYGCASKIILQSQHLLKPGKTLQTNIPDEINNNKIIHHDYDQVGFIPGVKGLKISHLIVNKCRKFETFFINRCWILSKWV